MFKKIIFVVFFLSVLVGMEGCTVLKPKSSVAGEWEETWGAGEETNVDYSDVYVIAKGKGKTLKMSCPKRNNYVFENIIFDGKKLTLRLIIKDLKYGAGDAWVDYELYLQEDQQSFKGTALTKAGKKANIIWKKREF